MKNPQCAYYPETTEKVKTMTSRTNQSVAAAQFHTHETVDDAITKASRSNSEKLIAQVSGITGCRGCRNYPTASESYLLQET